MILDALLSGVLQVLDGLRVRNDLLPNRVILPISVVNFVMLVLICPNSSVNWQLSWFAT